MTMTAVREQRSLSNRPRRVVRATVALLAIACLFDEGIRHDGKQTTTPATVAAEPMRGHLRHRAAGFGEGRVTLDGGLVALPRRRQQQLPATSATPPPPSTAAGSAQDAACAAKNKRQCANDDACVLDGVRGCISAATIEAAEDAACATKNSRQCANDDACVLDGVRGCISAATIEAAQCAALSGQACVQAAHCRWRRRKGWCRDNNKTPKTDQESGGGVLGVQSTCQAGADGVDDGSCGGSAYCKLAVGACGATEGGTGMGGTGKCVSTLVACAARDAPVCGCDGVTYANQCEARLAGMSVSAKGACEESEERPEPAVIVRPPLAPLAMACQADAEGSSDDCGEGAFCDVGVGRCGTASGSCKAQLEVCTKNMDPVCGCNGRTYPNACMAHAAGASVSFAGKCAPPPKTTEPPPGPDVQAVSCGAVDECDEGKFCRREACGDSGGQCEDQPLSCPENFDPVCGCDGQTHDNKCKASAAGTSVVSQGACAKAPTGPDAQVVDCEVGADGLSADCDKGEFCQLAGTGGCASSGQCEVKPDMCPKNMDPVCGCDGQSYSNACMARAAGASVSSQGRCLKPDINGVSLPLEGPPACRSGAMCREGDTCTEGTETCCGVTYDSFKCKCADGRRGLEYMCFYTDACRGRQECPEEEEEVEKLQLHQQEEEEEEKGEEPKIQSNCSVASDGVDGTSCTDEEFCRLEAEECRRPESSEMHNGICVAIPMVCTMHMEPVCGCNGVTYSNACAGAAARMSVAHDGPCDTKETEGGDAGGRPKPKPVHIAEGPSRISSDDCAPNAKCGAVGSTCTSGEETCCGETHPSLRCDCVDLDDGNPTYLCATTDACNLLACSPKATTEEAKVDAAIGLGVAWDTCLDEDQCFVDGACTDAAPCDGDPCTRARCGADTTCVADRCAGCRAACVPRGRMGVVQKDDPV